MSNHVFGENYSPADPGEVPFVFVGIVYVEARDGGGDDVVCWTWNSTLDDDLVVLVQCGRHGMERCGGGIRVNVLCVAEEVGSVLV